MKTCLLSFWKSGTIVPAERNPGGMFTVTDLQLSHLYDHYENSYRKLTASRKGAAPE